MSSDEYSSLAPIGVEVFAPFARYDCGPEVLMTREHRPGDVIGEHYRVVRELGRGSAAITYEGEDTRDGSRVAMLKPKFKLAQRNLDLSETIVKKVKARQR